MKGFIYKIESDCKQILYIGSTTRKLSDRFSSHKATKDCAIFKYLKDSNYSFSNGCELLKEYEIADRKHLLAYEQLWINVNKQCINKRQTYALLKKERGINYSKNYRLNNRSKCLEQQKKYDRNVRNKLKQCSCCLFIKSGELKRHQQTIKHQTLLKSKEQLIECLSLA